jgi:hypothetical protein
MYVICIQLVHICTVLGLREDFGKYYASWCLDKDLTNVLWTVDDALEYLFFPNEISTPVFSPLTNDWICRNIQSSYVCIWLVIIKKLYRTNLAKCYRQGISFTASAVEIFSIVSFLSQPNLKRGISTFLHSFSLWNIREKNAQNHPSSNKLERNRKPWSTRV